MRKSQNVVHTLFFTFVLIAFAGEAKATVYQYSIPRCCRITM
jgi:hypothetical protein